jgi:broad specificity phosphatase PhoE
LFATVKRSGTPSDVFKASHSPLTEKGVQQAWQVAERARTLGITHVITSDLGRTQQTARIIADACGCDVMLEPRLRELDMGVLEKRHIDTLTNGRGLASHAGERYRRWPYS